MFSRFETITNSAEETRLLGKRLGKTLKPGMTVLLKGELGSGKTVFAQGIALGLEVPEDCYVTSPSYTIINEYQGTYPFYHADLYRLENTIEPYFMELDDILGGNGITAVEWPERLPENYLSEFIDVQFEIIDDEKRKISINAKENAHLCFEDCKC